MSFLNCVAQYTESFGGDIYYITPEFQFGLTLPSNTNFPKRSLQKSLQINLCKKNFSSKKKWTTLLNYPTTGVYMSYTNFGNTNKLGRAISIAPFIEYNFKKPRFSRFYLKAGMGVSYINKLYNLETNSFNKAVTTHMNVNFYLFMNYEFTLNKKHPFRIGGGYLHHSNAHTKLPNMGLNSAIISISSHPRFLYKRSHLIENSISIPRSFQTYFEIKNGIGYHDFLSEDHSKKNVWSYAASIGTVYKDTYKIGLGLAYRKYQHYYDYIVENHIDEFYEKPNKYASNIFLFLHTEVLKDHVSINIDGGLNLYKPFYKTHYYLQDNENLGFDYVLKKLFLGRMGIKFYLNNTNKLPENNLFFGAHINSTLSQADFFEFSVGFVHRLPLKKWKWNGINTR